MNIDVHLRLKSNCLLGEGIAWHRSFPGFPGGAFVFVDIHGRCIHAYCQDSKNHRTWPVAERIGWLIPTDTPSTFIAGFQSGFARVRLTEQGIASCQWIDQVYATHPHMRLNDAKADSSGRIWAGSLNNDDELQPVGELFCLDPVIGHAVTADSGYCVANGPAIHPDGSFMLHTDSARRTIYAFDLDSDSARLSGKRVWKTLESEEGYPDGMTFDAQGHLWLAHWEAGLVSQYTSDGKLKNRIKLPVSNVTNLTFGGDGYKHLYVTSARTGLSETTLAAQPMAGGVFEITGHASSGLPLHHACI